MARFFGGECRRNVDLPQQHNRITITVSPISFIESNDFDYYRIDERWQQVNIEKAINCGQCYTPIHGARPRSNANKFNTKQRWRDLRQCTNLNSNVFFFPPFARSLLFWLTKIWFCFFFPVYFNWLDLFSNARNRKKRFVAAYFFVWFVL